jgi:hypothetical protein
MISFRELFGLHQSRAAWRTVAGCAAVLAGLCYCGTVTAKDPQPTSRVATKSADASKPGAGGPIDKSPLAPALKLAHESEEALQSIDDYTATFIKREMIKGKMLDQSMELKYRENPSSVYLKFIKPHEGREILYVPNQNQGKLLAHEEGLKGLVGTVGFLPTSSEAMDENRHPITEIGMRKMLGHIIQQWEQDARTPGVKVKFFPNAKVGQIDTKMIETIQPKPSPQAKFHITRLYLDKRTSLPVRVEQFGWPEKAGAEPPLLEEYNYTNLKTNVGLTDTDFSVKNPAYRF